MRPQPGFSLGPEGAAYLAIKAQVPIVPMALLGTRAVLAMHSKEFHPGRVILRVGQPIVTEGLTIRDRECITSEMRAQTSEMLRRS